MNQGRIRLDSGDWDWRLGRIQGNSIPHHEVQQQPAERADPEPESDPDPLVLLLENSFDPSHWMSRELDPHFDPEELGEQPPELEEWAKHPDRRQVTDYKGAVWLVESILPPRVAAAMEVFGGPPPMVLVSCGGSAARIMRLPRGRSLGTLRCDELLELLEAASWAGNQKRADTR